MNEIFIALLYSLPIILMTFFCYEACKDKKDIDTDKKFIFIIAGIASFIFVFINHNNDILILSQENFVINEYRSLNLFKKGLFEFELIDLSKILFLNVIIWLGRSRYLKSTKMRIIECVISVFVTVLGINPLYICLFLFVKFNLTYANNLKLFDNIISIIFFFLSVWVFPNSYSFSLVMFTTLFKNCKKIDKNKIFIYDRNKWVDVEKNMNKLARTTYLFIYFEEKLSNLECKEFLLFLDNISANNNVIRIHNDMFAVSFSEIDKIFGYSDEVVNNTIKSEIMTVEEMIKKRLFFPLVEEENHLYKYVMFKNDDFFYYKEFKKNNADKNELFSNKSYLIEVF